MKLNEIEIPALTPYYRVSPMPAFYQKLADMSGNTMDEDFIFAMKIVEKIKRDCQPYLKEMGQKDMFSAYDRGRALYRGLDSYKGFLKKRVRLGSRRPTDMNIDDHNMINKYFKKKYGAPFRNALFLTGNRRNAAGYNTGSGAAYYLIFPIGEFKFIWSSRITDLFSAIVGVEGDKVKSLLNRYQRTDLKAAKDSGNEIMLRCKSYYAVSNFIINDYDKAMNRYMEP